MQIVFVIAVALPKGAKLICSARNFISDSAICLSVAGASESLSFAGRTNDPTVGRRRACCLRQPAR